MRIVIFSGALNSSGDYLPFGGDVDFRITKRIAGDIVGEYIGSLPQSTLPDYNNEHGPWPFVAGPTYKTVFGGEEFVNEGLTDDEFDRMERVAGGPQSFRNIHRRIEHPKHNKPMRVDSPEYIAWIGDLRQLQILKSDERRDELLLGIKE